MVFFFLVCYIWSKFLQLTVGLRDLSQAEKKILLLQAEQLTKWQLFSQTFSTRTILSENSCHFVNLLTLQLQYFFSP